MYMYCLSRPIASIPFYEGGGGQRVLLVLASS